MRCDDAQKQSSAYLDSELSPERSAAVRGHLRTCESCRELFEQERELVEAASTMPAMDPPDAIWAGIQARIAKEEVKDSLEWPVSRWLRLHWRPIAGVGLALSAAAALLVLRSQGPLAGETDTLAENSTHRAMPRAPMQLSFASSRVAELAEADRQYLETIQDLRDMLEEDREQWTETEAAAVDARLARYRKESIGTRLTIANVDVGVQSRDTLYANYRHEIGFLQSALAGDLPGGDR